MHKIAFYVSGGASRLKNLFEKDSFILQDTHLIVFDNPPLESLQKLANKAKIPLLEIDYKKLGLIQKERNRYLSATLLNAFKKYKITYCFCFGRLLLEGELLKVYKNKIINFHPSILPMFAGNRAIDKQLESKSFLLGNTAHFIDSQMDSGPIIMQSVLRRSDFVDYESVLSLQIPMIEQIYMWIKENRIFIKNHQVYIKDSTSTPSFFPNLEISNRGKI